MTEQIFIVTIRDREYVAQEFGDLTIVPLMRFAALFDQSGRKILFEDSVAETLSSFMREVYFSLLDIFGESIKPFWNQESQRLSLHSSEVMQLINCATQKLSSDSRWAGSKAAQAQSSKPAAGQGFGQQAQRNPREEELASVLKAERIAELEAKLEALKQEMAEES